MIVLLDAGPLGLASNPKGGPTAEQCGAWVNGLLLGGLRVGIPEVADYEVRRELIRARKTSGLARLDELKEALLYIPLTTVSMLQAAEFWALARNRGRPTADAQSFDCDVILAAQAATLAREEGEDVVIATTNPGHLAFFTAARHWRDVTPRQDG